MTVGSTVGIMGNRITDVDALDVKIDDGFNRRFYD